MDLSFWLGLASIVVSIVLFILGFVFVRRSKKTLEYNVLSNAAIISSVHQDLGEPLTITLKDGQPAEKARLLMVKLTNVGNTAVKPGDYDELVQFTFDADVVIRGGIHETFPSDRFTPAQAKDNIELGSNFIKLKPLLLNPLEWIQMKFLIRDKSEMHIRGHIAEGEIQEYVPGRSNFGMIQKR